MQALKAISNFSRSHPRLALFAKFATVFAPIFWVSNNRLDPDFGWHLQAGNYFFENGVPKHDVFTYTAMDFEWINHEWGHDIVISALNPWLGYTGLAVLFAFIWTLSLFLAGHRARLITLLVAAGAMMPYLGVRATTWTVFFFSVLLLLCKSKNQRFKYLIPLLLLVWVNFHGGFMVGLAVVAYYTLTSKTKAWVYVLIACILATFTNAYGTGIYTEISRTLLDTSMSTNISEWHRFSLFNNTLLFISLWAAGFWIFDRKKVSNWFKLPPILLTASFLSTRHVPLFVLASVNEVDVYISKFLSQSLPKTKVRNHNRIRAVVVWVLAVLLIGAMAFTNRFVYYIGDKEASYPRQAIKYLNQNGCPGNVFAAYDFGGYLIWKLPEYKVYIDGRMPVWKDSQGQRYFDKYKTVLESQEFRATEFDKYNIRCVILPVNKKEPPSGIHQELIDIGWNKETSVSDSVLLLAPPIDILTPVEQ